LEKLVPYRDGRSKDVQQIQKSKGDSNKMNHKYAEIDGLKVFYREAGEPRNPAMVLLHGFPSSSHMYRNLIPKLADKFYVVAPDYPGFGNSDAPSPLRLSYTFDKLSEIVENLLSYLGVNRFTLFIQDYGSPVGFRIALRHPDWIEAIVCQNGNAYEEGFTGVWDTLRQSLWKKRSPESEAPLANFFTREGVTWIYTEGTRDLKKISPDNWNMDLSFLARPENHRIQLDLFYDYRKNVDQYPKWHEYLRNYQPPTLIVWGANDPIFTQDGARAFGRDLKDVEIHMLDTGHFALEDHCDEIAVFIKTFYDKKVPRRRAA
jgi:pimeloyl-ACP methyl ester carboxylesterase